jgi:hypothetical protein
MLDNMKLDDIFKEFNILIEEFLKKLNVEMEGSKNK